MSSERLPSHRMGTRHWCLDTEAQVCLLWCPPRQEEHVLVLFWAVLHGANESGAGSPSECQGLPDHRFAASCKARRRRVQTWSAE